MSLILLENNPEHGQNEGTLCCPALSVEARAKKENGS